MTTNGAKLASLLAGSMVLLIASAQVGQNAAHAQGRGVTHYNSPYLCPDGGGYQTGCPACSGPFAYAGCEYGLPPAGWTVQPCQPAPPPTPGCDEEIWDCGDLYQCPPPVLIDTCFPSNYTVCT